jgi:hypothetical protein
MDDPRGPPPTLDATPTGPVTREEMMALRRRKLEAEARKIEIANAHRENELISRELVVRAFGGVDGAFRRLLTDAATSIANRAMGLASSGATLEDIRATVRKIMSRELERAKHAMHRSIDNIPPPRPKGATRRPKTERSSST